MANNITHTLVGGFSGLALAVMEQNKENPINPLLAISTSVVFAKLPDILEPSLNNPHHRQLFHSVMVLVAVGYGIRKTYDWAPEDGIGKFFRALALCAEVGYVSHLLLDGLTPRSLPLIGKI